MPEQTAECSFRLEVERERRGGEVGGNSLSCFKNSHTKGNAWQYFCLLIYVAAEHGCREGGRKGVGKGRHNVRERVEVAVRGKVKPRKRRQRERKRESEMF